MSRRWRRRAGVGGERPDNQLEGWEEGGGGRGEGDAQHDEQLVEVAVAFFWGRGGASGGEVGGWAAVRRTTRSRAAAFGGTLWCVGRCCRGRGGRARHGGGGGERRWCDGPRGGRGLQRLGTTQRCDGRCCRGRGGGATDDKGGCSGVFVFYLHMGMGKIHWREEADPIILIE